MDKILVFGDTETSGLSISDRIVQLAYSYKYKPNTHYGSNFFIKPKRFTIEELANPGVPIDPSAAMTTDIDDMDVQDAPKLVETRAFKELVELMKKPNTFFIAYNAPFDIDMLEKDGLFIPPERVIDLYRIVKHLYKETKIEDRNGNIVPLANNKMQYFRRLLKFDEKTDFQNLIRDYGLTKLHAHRAESDVIVLEYFFYYVMQEFDLTFEQMVELSNKPVLEPFIMFGNVFEKGTHFDEVLTTSYIQYGKEKQGYDYIDWASGNMTLSVDTGYSLKIHFFNHLVNGDIPYNPKFAKYINYGLVFETDPEKIESALNIIGQDPGFQAIARTKFKEKLDEEIEENLENELGDRFPALFLLRYLEKLEEESDKEKEKEAATEELEA